MKHFLSDQWDCFQAKKRGGDRSIISFDLLTAEELYQVEPSDDRTLKRLYEQSWAQTLLAKFLENPSEEQRAKGMEELFSAVRPFVAWLTAMDSDYSEAAEQLKMKENAVRVQVFRLRKRYTEILREEIAQTVATPEDVVREMDYLFDVLRGE